MVLVAVLLLGLLNCVDAQKTAQQAMAKAASQAEHSDAMAAVDAGLGGDGSRKGLLAGLAATSERLRALEAEGADAHQWMAASNLPHAQVATSSQVLAELKHEAKQELQHSVAAELNGDPYPGQAATSTSNSQTLTQVASVERILAHRGRANTDDDDLGWGYGQSDGPSTWGAEFERCKAGTEQSPIDIERAGKSTQPEDILDIAVLRWDCNNGGGSATTAASAAQKWPPGSGALGDTEQQGLFLTLPLNSRFQEADAPPQAANRRLFAANRRMLEATEVYTGHALEVEAFGTARLQVGGAWYMLREVLLHTPSEHTLDGRRFDLEMQLVHVVAHGEGGYRYLIVSVLFSTHSGDPSPSFLAEVVAAVPSVRESRRVRVQGVDVEKMTEAVQKPLRQYFRYQGSLTTPPCSEGVDWFVAGAPLPLSPAHLEVIAALQGSNARPVQPLNSRVVRYVP